MHFNIVTRCRSCQNICPSSPAALCVLQYCSAAVLQAARTWLSLCKPEERGHVVLQQTGEQRLLVTAELQLLNTAVTVAVCAEAQTSVCW